MYACKYETLQSPRLINLRSGKNLTIAELTNPTAMRDVLKQLTDEIWHAAPQDPDHKYKHHLPFDYAWYRITEHCLDELEARVHNALADMFEHGVVNELLTVSTLVVR